MNQLLNPDNIYRKLQKHLDRMPIGFPETETGVDIKILKRFFTPIEAEIAIHLSMIQETLSRIYLRIKYSNTSKLLKKLSKRELKEHLHNMGAKGSIIEKRRLNGKLIFYRSAMLAIGIYEFQAKKLTKDFVEDLDTYWDNEFGKDMWSTKINQLRTIPVEESIELESNIFVYDDVRRMVERSKILGVTSCVCRDGMDLKGEPCKVTKERENCFVFDEVAKYYLDHNLAKEIDKKKAFEILEQCQKDGLVLQPGNARKLRFICTCCGCCCEVLKHVKKFQHTSEYYNSNYFAQVNSNCIGCKLCVKICQLDAIEMKNYSNENKLKAFIQIDRCIGCGLCVTKCQNDAISLVKKEQSIKPPIGITPLNMKILRKKRGIKHMLKLWVKIFLFMKV